ncbi:MAG: hypothetical protein KGN02_12120 [bacterium]|nr:hypothetical protein [bacterium]
MKSRILIAAALVAVALAACSFENKYEREADRITRAVMANDLAPVQKDLTPGLNISRVKVAEWSDELSAQGKLLSIKESKECTPGYHCFVVKFQKHTYAERLQMDDQNRVTQWQFHMLDRG